MPIISDAELSSIAREFGPSLDEDVAYLLRRTEGVRQGLGRTTALTTAIGPLGCRIIYVGNMTVREKLEAGQLSTSGDYIISIPAGIVVYTSDVIQVKGKLWKPNMNVIAGQRIVPSDNRDQVFLANNAGRLGEEEPVWPPLNPEAVTVSSGSVDLQNSGLAERYQIIQIAGPNTYGDKFSTKMACDLKQEVRVS